MSIEQTLVILKPDAINRKLVGKIIQRIEEKNYSIKYFQMHHLTQDDLDYHYFQHKMKDFYSSLVEFMRSGPVIIMLVCGENVIQGMRKLSGLTDPNEAESGSIRGCYASNKTQNLIHSSDSIESAKREINYFVYNIEE